MPSALSQLSSSELRKVARSLGLEEAKVNKKTLETRVANHLATNEDEYRDNEDLARFYQVAPSHTSQQRASRQARYTAPLLSHNSDRYEVAGSEQFAREKQRSRSLPNPWMAAARKVPNAIGGVQVLSLLLEATGLFWNTSAMPNNMITDHALTHAEMRHMRSNWWTSDNRYWAVVAAWSLVSWILPFVFSCFISSTHQTAKRRPADPLTFNMVKAILILGAYRLTTMPIEFVTEDPFMTIHWSQRFQEGFSTMCDSVPGGHYGLVFGAVIGILARLDSLISDL